MIVTEVVAGKKVDKYLLRVVKPIKNTHLFRKNQRCWVLNVQGDNSIRVRAKHRGKSRYLTAWLHEGDYESNFISVEVTKEFYERITGKKNGYNWRAY